MRKILHGIEKALKILAELHDSSTTAESNNSGDKFAFLCNKQAFNDASSCSDLGPRSLNPGVKNPNF